MGICWHGETISSMIKKAGIPQKWACDWRDIVMAQHFEEFASSLLPIWEMSIPDIPSRSRLYNLTPRGLNSPLVESLTSYICRLAYEHHVEVGTLIQFSIAPVLGK